MYKVKKFLIYVLISLFLVNFPLISGLFGLAPKTAKAFAGSSKVTYEGKFPPTNVTVTLPTFNASAPPGKINFFWDYPASTPTDSAGKPAGEEFLSWVVGFSRILPNGQKEDWPQGTYPYRGDYTVDISNGLSWGGHYKTIIDLRLNNDLTPLGRANIDIVLPQGETAGSYPPSKFGVNWSTYDDSGTAAFTLYWEKPTTNPTNYSDPNGGTVETSELQWAINVYDRTTGEHFSPWVDGYDKLTDTYTGDYWKHSFYAKLELRWTEKDPNPTLGSAELSFTLPDSPPGSSGGAGTGDCPVQNLKAMPENYAYGETGNHVVHFSWTWNTSTSPVDCSKYHAVYVTRPDGSAAVGGQTIPSTSFKDVDAKEGVYTFKTTSQRDGNAYDSSDVHGENTVTVTFDTGGTSTDDPTSGDPGPDTRPGSPGYCEGFTGISGILAGFFNPIGYIICSLIYVFEQLARWILDQAAFIINA